MKIFFTLGKIAFLFLICFCIDLNAQTVSHNFKNKMNDVFAGIDLNKVPHDLLLDYAMEFLDVEAFD